jgi:hypothetical protein
VDVKKILIVTLGHLSAGEFTIAFEFSKGLPRDHFQVHFLTSERGQGYLKENSIDHTVLERSVPINLNEDKMRNKQICDRLIRDFRPDCIIASDIYTLWYSFHWSGLDYDALREYRILLGSFDSYEFGSTDYTQDYYGGYKAVLPDFIDRCDFIIRYCPLNKPGKSDQKVKYTPLFAKTIEPSIEEKSDFNNRFRPKGIEKVLFMVSSNWEELNINRFPALTNMSAWIPEIIMNYLSLLDGRINIIHIGPQSWEIKAFDHSEINYYHINSLSPEQFDFYLSCSDILLSTNLISTTVIKAVFAGVPPLVFQNEKLINFAQLADKLEKMPSWYREMANSIKIAYPFRLFPFGWFSFLKPLISDNPYMQSIVPISLFQKGKTVETLQKYLYNDPARLALREIQKEYVRKILELPSPAEVIDSLDLE